MAHAGAPDLVALQPEQLAQLADMLRAGAGGAGTTRLRRMTEATPGAWMEHRRHFTKIVELQVWNDLRQRRELLASIQEKAGNAIIDVDIEEFPTIQELLEAVEARFMPAAAGSTARSNYNAARQLSTESVREWHTRLRELFNLAYPNQNPNNHAHCLDLFVQGLANANVKFFVGSQQIEDFHAALVAAERSETASKRTTSSAGALHALSNDMNVMNINGQSGLACYFCTDTFSVSNPHTKAHCPYFKAAKNLFMAESQGRSPTASGGGPSHAAPPRFPNQRRGGRNFKRGGGRPRNTNSVHALPSPAQAAAQAATLDDSSENEAGN